LARKIAKGVQGGTVAQSHSLTVPIKPPAQEEEEEEEEEAGVNL
jgi:hypothetical protein